jgi:hypothetical protein
LPQYVTFEKTEGGNLKISLLPEGREELDDLLARELDSDRIFHELVEHQLGNGWDSLPPETIGALTESIILSDEAELDDMGDFVNVGRCYWFPNYQVENPIETLRDKGSFTFTGVG